VAVIRYFPSKWLFSRPKVAVQAAFHAGIFSFDGCSLKTVIKSALP
jgi:hypothetical protein